MPNTTLDVFVNRSFLVCMLAVLVSVCAADTVAQVRRPSFVFEVRMGLARWRENRGCLAVFNAAITTGTRVTLVEQPESTDPASVKEAAVVERLQEVCDDGLSFSNNLGVAPSFYRLSTAEGVRPPTRIVFAILDAPARVATRNGQVETDLDGDGANESFRVCHSTETVHFMVWTGSPAQGRPRWHGAYYAGYDMTPSCTKQDEAGIVALEKR